MDALVPSAAQIMAAGIFALAVLHTFLTKQFEHLARIQPAHAGLWHLVGEVETVFAIWAAILLVVLALQIGPQATLSYFESRVFTEPAFIFVIMVIAASRPVLEFATALMSGLARLLPLRTPVSYYFTALSVGPLLGSFITEPAAMTLCAMLMRERYFALQAPRTFKYGTLGVLFVNISIGGTLTPFAAPPVLMVAERWNWDIGFMLTTFGWKAAAATLVNAGVATYIFRSYLAQLRAPRERTAEQTCPWTVIAVHIAFLAAVVFANHHPLVFGALFILFLGFADAYRRYQNRLILREGLMVGLFLAGLVILGGMQEWWLAPVLSGLGPNTLYYGATVLTAVTDNAALTYLGSLVDQLSPEAKYSLVAGAVTGGGLTVIANAPNPAGFAILKSTFEDGAISPLWLAVAALLPTGVAIIAFQLLPGY